MKGILQVCARIFTRKYRKALILCLICSIACASLSGCNAVNMSDLAKTISKYTNSVDDVEIEQSEADEEDKVISDSGEAGDEEAMAASPDDKAEAEDNDTLEQEEEELDVIDYTSEDMVDFDADNAFIYCRNPVCRIDEDRNNIMFSCSFESGIPITDDEMIYLFEIATYETESTFDDKKPVISADIRKNVRIKLEYADRMLFARFVPAVKYEGKYIPISYGQYITNPEILADNTQPYLEVGSKKGLLLDANTLYSDKFEDLDVKRVVYNIPLSYVCGKSDNSEYPTIEYEYNGETYYFNGYLLAGFDSLFRYLTEEGCHNTAIILNDWNRNYPELIHPMARNKTWQSMYYAFNTEEEAGVRLLEATAMFLAQRYSGSEYGMVYDWVIANEVNQQAIWNYMSTDDIFYYTDSFERSFRTFYNAIKSKYAYANVYYSIDNEWNDNGGNNRRFFNGKDLVSVFNYIATSRGNYDWGLALHPYPMPLTKVKFWNGEHDKSHEAKVVTPMNLSVITDMMKQEEFLDTKGNVRNIGVTELGFSSKAGQKLQAAAFAYCYYIIEDNEYINSFLLNRQTDDTEALKSGLALGIYNNNYSSKIIADVFTNIDNKKGDEYIPEMLEIIGADSLEEALERAR